MLIIWLTDPLAYSAGQKNAKQLEKLISVFETEHMISSWKLNLHIAYSWGKKPLRTCDFVFTRNFTKLFIAYDQFYSKAYKSEDST